MTVRLFGLMGPRYDLTAKGVKYYIAACGVALAACLYLVVTGLAWIDDPGSVGWLVPALIFMVAFFATLRLVVLASLNGTPLTSQD